MTFVEPGSRRENSYCESINAKLRNKLLEGDIFYRLVAPQIIIERRRSHDNKNRPHSSLGYRMPAPEPVFPIEQRLPGHYR